MSPKKSNSGPPRLLDAVPHGVHEGRVVGIGGHRVLVVEEARVGVLDQELWPRPGKAPVLRAGVAHGGVAEAPLRRQRIGVGDEAHRVQRAVGRERDPGVGGALVVAAPRADRARWDHDLGPAVAAVRANARQVALGAAVRPAVLLVEARHVVLILRVDVDPGLYLGLWEDHSGPGAGRRGTAAERARARRLDRGRGGQRPGLGRRGAHRDRQGDHQPCQENSPHPAPVHQLPPCR